MTSNKVMARSPQDPVQAAGVPILAGRGLSKIYAQRGMSRSKSPVAALSDVEVEVFEGEIVAIVGESGCGKSTLSRILLGVLAATDGTVEFDGVPVKELDKETKAEYRRNVQVVFQDPASSLNPRQRIRNIIGAVALTNKVVEKDDLDAFVVRQLEAVGLTPASSFIDRFPHQLSGGQQQRVAIARAFSLSPRVVIADEPLSALDVSVQAQVLDVMIGRQRMSRAAYLLVTHDLHVVEEVATRVVVMYLGRVVEAGDAATVFSRARHPYTQALLAARLEINPDKVRIRDRDVLQGDIPTVTDIPAGCPFHTRCPIAQPICETDRPPLEASADGTQVACHFPGEIQPEVHDRANLSS